jgi:hypothetical protein
VAILADLSAMHVPIVLFVLSGSLLFANNGVGSDKIDKNAMRIIDVFMSLFLTDIRDNLFDSIFMIYDILVINRVSIALFAL